MSASPAFFPPERGEAFAAAPAAPEYTPLEEALQVGSLRPEEERFSQTDTRPSSQNDTLSQHETLQPLSAMLTHRLGTLTSVIAGHADLLVDTPSPQEQRQIAMSILEATTQINDLLADLHHYSRPLQPVFRSVPVCELTQDLAALLAEAERERVRWETAVPSDRNIHADERLLRQALLSLLQNALDATAPSGAVSLRTRLEERDEEDGGGGAPAVVFEVWNDGVIALDDPTRIFEPFFTTHARHWGVGLSIARNIATRHGGSLRLAANSPEAGGTCLALRIQRQSEECDPPHAC